MSGALITTIGDLEKVAGITDRTALWMQFAHIKGVDRKGHIEVSRAFQTATAELRHRANLRFLAILGAVIAADGGAA